MNTSMKTLRETPKHIGNISPYDLPRSPVLKKIQKNSDDDVIEFSDFQRFINKLYCSNATKVKQIDEMDAILANKFSRFLMQRADNFIVLRRKPMPVYLAIGICL